MPWSGQLDVKLKTRLPPCHAIISIPGTKSIVYWSWSFLKVEPWPCRAEELMLLLGSDSVSDSRSLVLLHWKAVVIVQMYRSHSICLHPMFHLVIFESLAPCQEKLGENIFPVSEVLKIQFGRVYIYIHMYTSVYVYICVYIYIYTHTYVYIS